MRSIMPCCKPRTYTTKFIFKRLKKKRKQKIHICCLVCSIFFKSNGRFLQKIQRHTEENQSLLQFYLPKTTYVNILEYRLHIPRRQVCTSVCAHTHTYFTKTSVYVCLYTHGCSITYMHIFVFQFFRLCSTLPNI